MENTKTLQQQVETEIASGMNEVAAAIAKEMATPDTALVSPKQLAQKVEQGIAHDMEFLKTVCRDGLSHCIEALIHDTTVDMEKLITDLQTSFEPVNSMEAVEKLGAGLMEEKTWKELLDIPNSVLQTLYKGAKSIYDAKRYNESEVAFSFLTIMEPRLSQFWLALGHSAFKNHHQEKAINAYAMASMLDQADPWPHIHAANCFEANADYPHALIALEIAREVNRDGAHRDDKLETDLVQRINVLKHKA